ncbi:hypothetical protein SCOR_23825 [Sulfidibacter corallicola]
MVPAWRQTIKASSTGQWFGAIATAPPTAICVALFPLYLARLLPLLGATVLLIALMARLRVGDKGGAGQENPAASVRKHANRFYYWFLCFQLGGPGAMLVAASVLIWWRGTQAWVCAFGGAAMGFLVFALAGLGRPGSPLSLALCWQKPDASARTKSAWWNLCIRAANEVERDMRKPDPLIARLSRILDRSAQTAERIPDLVQEARRFAMVELRGRFSHALRLIAILFGISLFFLWLPLPIGDRAGPWFQPGRPLLGGTPNSPDNSLGEEERNAPNAPAAKRGDSTESEQAQTSSEPNSSQAPSESSGMDPKSSGDRSSAKSGQDGSKDDDAVPKSKSSDGTQTSGNQGDPQREAQSGSQVTPDANRSRAKQTPRDAGSNAASPDNAQSNQEGATQGDQPDEEDTEEAGDQQSGASEETGQDSDPSAADGAQGTVGEGDPSQAESGQQAQQAGASSSAGSSAGDSTEEGGQSGAAESQEQKANASNGDGQAKATEDSGEPGDGGESGSSTAEAGSGGGGPILGQRPNQVAAPPPPGEKSGMVVIEIPDLGGHPNSGDTPRPATDEGAADPNTLAYDGSALRRGVTREEVLKPDQPLPNWIAELLKNRTEAQPPERKRRSP